MFFYPYTNNVEDPKYQYLIKVILYNTGNKGLAKLIKEKLGDLLKAKLIILKWNIRVINYM